MEDLATREQIVETDYDTYRLSYHIHRKNEEGFTYYGVSIFQYKDTKEEISLYDRAVIPAFSDNLKKTKAFFQAIVEGYVFPVHLYSIADDWYGMTTS